MDIEKEIFKNTKVNTNKLIEYGFDLKEKTYVFCCDLIDNLELMVFYEDTFCIKVMDKDMNEEYLGYKLTNSGNYISKINEEIEKKLIRIKEYVCDSLNYSSNQANRIDQYMEMVYGKLERTFVDSPDIGVYKESSGDKWYAIIIPVPGEKVDSNSNCKDLVEVINLKVDKLKINELLRKRGIYPAYHMNKNNWVSIILNDTLTDEEIILMINESYDLVQNSLNSKKYYKYY